MRDGDVMYVHGVDSAQALLLAFQLAGVRLRYTADNVTLTWFGESDLGFPLPDLTNLPESSEPSS